MAATVAVIGAGVAGLSAAWRLKQLNYDVRVFEATSEAGGLVRSRRIDGFLVDFGPNLAGALDPAVGAMLEAAGVLGLRVPVSPAASRRYVLRHGRLEVLPNSPIDLLASTVLSSAAKARLMREPLIPPGLLEQDESVADFVRRRLGEEALTYLINPVVGSTYAGDPEELSVRHAFPRVAALERDHGSLVRGVAAGGEAGALIDPGGTYGGRELPWSLPEGMQQIVAPLVAQLGPAIRLNLAVERVAAEGNGWAMHLATGEQVVVDGVVSAVPAHALPHLLGADDPVVADIASIRYAPVATIALGFPRASVAHPLDASGVLVPSAENRRILGMFFSSAMFPGRAPDGMALVTVFAGGALHPEIVGQADTELVATALNDVRDLLGITGEPVMTALQRWPHGIPQYNRGFGLALDAMRHLERARPGLVLAGNYRDGVAMGDAMASGLRAAERLHRILGRPAQPVAAH